MNLIAYWKCYFRDVLVPKTTGLFAHLTIKVQVLILMVVLLTVALTQRISNNSVTLIYGMCHPFFLESFYGSVDGGSINWYLKSAASLKCSFYISKRNRSLSLL